MDQIEYEKHIKAEREFYDKSLYLENLTEKTSSALTYFLDAFHQRTIDQIGQNAWQYTINTVNKKIKEKSKINILSLGSGPGGLEMILAESFSDGYFMECHDINEESLKLGQEKADKSKFNIKFIQTDINKIELESNKYDIIFAHASLHHMLNHEQIAKQVKKSMKEDGEFIVFDLIYKNGMMIWPETKRIANILFKLLPEKYRFHKYDPIGSEPWTELPDVDLSTTGFECIRSQDLLPVLKQEFKVKFEVLGFAFARRFFDVQFGPNYDLNNPFDKAIMDTVLNLDHEYSKKFNLKPENIFIVLKK